MYASLVQNSGLFPNVLLYLGMHIYVYNTYI